MSKILQIRLILLLEEKGPLRRKDLVQELNRPRSTIYDNLNQLHKEDKVESFRKKTNGKRGAPYTFWRIKENGGAN